MITASTSVFIKRSNALYWSVITSNIVKIIDYNTGIHVIWHFQLLLKFWWKCQANGFLPSPNPWIGSVKLYSGEVGLGRQSKKHLKNWGNMFRLLETSKCNYFCQSSCQKFNLQCAWSRTMRDERKCEKFVKILSQVLVALRVVCLVFSIDTWWVTSTSEKSSIPKPHQITQDFHCSLFWSSQEGK